MKPDVNLIGVKFKTPNRETIETVIDIHSVYNMAGELVRIEYVSQYQFLNQTMTRIVAHATIVRYRIK
jgi:hypothetical protein